MNNPASQSLEGQRLLHCANVIVSAVQISTENGKAELSAAV